MSRTTVPFAFARLHHEVFAAALASFALAACGSDGSGATQPGAAAGSGGAAGNATSMMPSTGSGGAAPVACDTTDATCTQSCPIAREAVRCDTPDPCPVGFVLSLTCGADPAAADPPSACHGVLPRTGAFCAKQCPDTVPSTCTDGTARCGEGWKLLSTCAG